MRKIFFLLLMIIIASSLNVKGDTVYYSKDLIKGNTYSWKIDKSRLNGEVVTSGENKEGGKIEVHVISDITSKSYEINSEELDYSLDASDFRCTFDGDTYLGCPLDDFIFPTIVLIDGKETNYLQYLDNMDTDKLIGNIRIVTDHSYQNDKYIRSIVVWSSTGTKLSSDIREYDGLTGLLISWDLMDGSTELKISGYTLITQKSDSGKLVIIQFYTIMFAIIALVNLRRLRK